MRHSQRMVSLCCYSDSCAIGSLAGSHASAVVCLQIQDVVEAGGSVQDLTRAATAALRT